MIGSSQRKFVICLDTALLITFLLLLSPRMTGLALHEVLGLFFLILVIIHLLVAWQWIQSSIKRFFKSLTRRGRFNFFLNLILFVLVTIELVSGFFISQVVLPRLGIKTINDQSWRLLHNRTLNFTTLAAGLHIAMNWRWIASVFKKRLRVWKHPNKSFSPKIMTILLRTSVLVLAAGVVALVLYGLLGPPTLKRLYMQDEIARFRPTLGHAIIQFFGETFLVALFVFIGHKWLRIRL
jgi:uncharacterized protein DUF4405